MGMEDGNKLTNVKFIVWTMNCINYECEYMYSAHEKEPCQQNIWSLFKLNYFCV